MIGRSDRALLPDEQEGALRGLPLLDWKFRRLAKTEAQSGHAEVLEFDVAHAWNLISCEGPPCCPNSWLVSAGGDEFVYLSSWDLLRAVEESFPGTRLRLEVLPLTRRLLFAQVKGPLIPAAQLPFHANAHLPPLGRSHYAVVVSPPLLDVLGGQRP